MKVGLILPGNIWFLPYVKIYTDILDELKVNYDLISWNRDGNDKKIGYQFELRAEMNGGVSKLLPYIKYAQFIKRIVSQNNYERLIVFGPQVSIFIADFLSKYYNKKYIFDYRDLSIEQKWIFKFAFHKVINNSFANVISSPGFEKCLPSGYKYLISHNFDINVVREALNKKESSGLKQKEINVLTIGGIRDYSSNVEVLKNLSNKKNINISFVGKGGASPLLQDFSKANNIKNVEFKGFYPKEEEHKYIESCTFLNIFYPKIISHSTALSNRFYNALIYKKPMIVTTNSIQGNYVEKYNLGLSLNDCSCLSDKLEAFLRDFNQESFNESCNLLLREFIKDYNNVHKMVEDFVNVKVKF